MSNHSAMPKGAGNILAALVLLGGLPGPAGVAMGQGAAASSDPASWECPRYLPAKFLVNMNSAPAGARQAIDAGFQTWEADAGSWVDFADPGLTDASSPADDGANIVWWQPDPGDFRTRFWLYMDGSRIRGFDIQFNSRFSFSTSPSPSAYDIQSAASYEAGHVLGLANVADDPSQIMGGDFAPGEIRRDLGVEDVAQVRALYPYEDLAANFVAQSPSNSDPVGVFFIPGHRYLTDLTPIPFQATFRNVGRTPWGLWGGVDREVRIVTTLPRGRVSPFWDPPTWISPSRPVGYRGAAVCRGEELTLAWYMRAPQNVHEQRFDESFGLRLDGLDRWLVTGVPRWSRTSCQC